MLVWTGEVKPWEEARRQIVGDSQGFSAVKAQSGKAHTSPILRISIHCYYKRIYQVHVQSCKDPVTYK
jgi:hypothetical protein